MESRLPKSTQPSGPQEARRARLVSLNASDEEVILHVRGFVVLRAAYEAEGYYDEAADGDPEEQDMYLIEVLDAPRARRAAEAIDGEAVWPLADMGLSDPTLRRLFPSARWTAEAAGPTLVGQYLLVLAWALQEEERPESRQRLLHASAGWSPAAITDAFQSLAGQVEESRAAGPNPNPQLPTPNPWCYPTGSGCPDCADL